MYISQSTRELSIESLITISEVLNVSTDYILLDISNNEDKKIAGVINAIDKSNNDKYQTLY